MRFDNIDDIGDFGDAEGYSGPLQEGGRQQADRLGAQSRQRRARAQVC